MMELLKILKTPLFILLLLLVACEETEDASLTSATNGLDFTITALEDTGLLVGVTPTLIADGNTVYSIHFGDSDAKLGSDVKLTNGLQVTYQYLAIDTSYDITVTATTDNNVKYSLTKTYKVNPKLPMVLADFEHEDNLNLRNDTNGNATIMVNAKADKNEKVSNVGVITNRGTLFEAVSINLTEHINITSASTITLDYYQSIAQPVGVLLKLKNAKTKQGFDVEVKIIAAAKIGWQTLTFDFANNAKNSFPYHENSTVRLDEYQKLLVCIGFGRELSGTFYIDNVVGGTLGSAVPDIDKDGVIDSIDDCKTVVGITENGCPIDKFPFVEAPIPDVSPNNVISLFSDAYTNVPVDSWRTTWSIGDYTKVAICSNNAKRYNALNMVGIETTEDHLLDISSMTHVHIDIWSENAVAFGLRLVDFGLNEIYDEGDDTQGAKTVTNFVNGQWVSLDFPITDFTGLKGKKNIAQYILTASPIGEANVHIDNFYFYK